MSQVKPRVEENEGTSGVAQCTCPKKDGIETIASSLKIMKLAWPTVTGLISTGY
jgi:hypothetical protein